MDINAFMYFLFGLSMAVTLGIIIFFYYRRKSGDHAEGAKYTMMHDEDEDK